MPLILIVDDDPNFLEIFSAKLTAAGYKVEVASDGKEGIQKAKAIHPQLVLMDMKMPNMTGADALLSLKEDPSTKDAKVLFLSNLGDPREEGQQLNNRFATEAGAIGYLKKTDDLEVLLDRVKEALKK